MFKILKKSVAITLLVSMIAGIALVPGMISTASAVEQPQQENLLANAGFEKWGPIPGWTASSDTNVMVAGGAAHDGSYAIRIFDDQADQKFELYTHKVDATAGVTYMASAQLRGSGMGYLTVRYFDANDAVLGQQTVSANAGGDWTELKVELAAPDGTVKADVLLSSDVAGTADLYFDSVCFEKKPALKRVVYEEDFSNLTMNSQTGTPEGWKLAFTDSMTAALASEDTSYGQYLKLDKTTVPERYDRTVYIDIPWEVKAGYQYDLTFEARCDKGTTVYLTTFANRTRIDNPYTSVAASTTFAPASHNFAKVGGTPTADADTIRITFSVGRLSITCLDIDNIKLIETVPDNSNEAMGNRLVNASFEEQVKVDNWTVSKNADTTVSLISDKVYSGKYALKAMDASTTSDIQISSDKVSVTAGESYTATVRVYGDDDQDGSQSANIYLRYFDANGTRISNFANSVKVVKGEWVKLSLTKEAPAGAVKALVLVNVGGSTIGTFVFDDASLLQVKKDPSKIIWDDFDDTSISSGLPVGWKGAVDQYTTYTLTTDDKMGDTGKSLKQVKTGNSTRVIYFEKEFAVQEGKLYRAEVDYKGTTGIQFWLQTLDSSSSYVDRQNKGTGNTNGQWVHLVNEFVATENATRVRIVIGIGDTNEGTAWFDNVRVGEYDAPQNETEDTSAVLFQETFNETVISDNGLPSGFTGTNPSTTFEVVEGGAYLQQVKDIDATDSRYIYFEVPWTVNPDSSYRVEMDYMCGSTASVYFTTFDGSTSIENLSYTKKGQDTRWTHISKDFTVTKAASKLRVTIGLEGRNSGTARYDNVRVYEVGANGDVLIAEKNFSGGKLQVTGIPKGWGGAAAEDTFYKIVEQGHALKLVKTAETDSSVTLTVQKDLTFEAGKYYSAYVEFLGDGKCELKVELLNGNSTVQTESKKVGGDAALWTNAVVDFLADKAANAVRFTIEIPKNAVGEFLLDNLTLLDDVRLNTKGELTLVNPSFEIGKDENGKLKGWIIPKEQSWTVITDQHASDGKYSLMLVDDMPKGGVAVYSERFAVDPKGYYRMSVACHGNAPFFANIMFYNKYGTLIATEKASTQRNDDGWFVIKVSAAAPEDAVDACVCLATTVMGVGNQSFDNVVVTKTGESPVATGQPSDVEPEGGWQIVNEEHPRMLFTKDELEEMKLFAKDTTANAFGIIGAEVYKNLMQAARVYVEEDSYTMTFVESVVTVKLDPLEDFSYLPQLHVLPEGYNVNVDTYPYWSKLASRIRERIQTMALAYALSGEQKYADRIIEMAMDYCSWDHWRDTWHNTANLGTYTEMEVSHILIAVSTVYDVCYDILTEEQRELMRNCIKTKGLDYLFDDMIKLDVTNYWMCRMSGLMTGASVIYDGSEELQEYLTRAYNYCKWYLDYLSHAGLQEGHSYTQECMQYITDGLNVMARVTGNDDLIKHSFFTDVLPQWVLATMTPSGGRFAAISDAAYTTNYEQLFNILNSQLDDKFAGFYLRSGEIRLNPIRQMLYTSRNPQYYEPSEVYEPVTFAEAVGIAGLRTGFGEHEMLLTIVGNKSNLYHNHWDQNSFIYIVGDKMLAADAGQASTAGGPVTIYGRYYGHNIIFVDGEPQSEKGTGSLKEVMNSNLYGHVIGSAAAAYGEDMNGPILDQFDRSAIMMNHEDNPYYVIVDELSSQREHLYDFNLFAGSWNAAEIDGNAFTADSAPTKGNKLTVSGGGGKLFVEYVSGKPMDISIMKHDGGSPLIQAHTEKAKDKQYMTILSSESGNSSIMEYSFVDLIGSEKVTYKSSSKNPEVTKSVSVQGVPLHFFRGELAGDYITFPFVAPESGNFELIMKTAHNFNYGQYKVYVDGKYINTYDGCGTKTELVYHSLGQMDITAGEHTLKLELVGTSSLVGGMLISVSSVVFSTGASLGFGDIYTEEVYDTDKVLGAKIHHSDYNSDIILYNRTKGSVTAGGLITDGKHASVIGLMTDGYMEGFSAVDATSVAFNGTTLVKAEKPVDVAADYRGVADYTITTDVAQTVKLYGVAAKKVLVDGKAVELRTGADLVQVTLEPGTHTVSLKLSKMTKIEYLMDGGVISTIYDQDGKIIRQHTKNADGTELLTENGKVILKIYIDEDTLCLVKEELAEDGTFTVTYYDITKNLNRVEITHPDGSLTEIDYQSDGTIVTAKFDKDGNNLEGIIQYPDGSVTKAEYKDDRTVTTKMDKDGKVLSVTTQFKDGRREEIVYNTDGSVVTTTYAKGGKLASVHTKNADGTAVLVEYLEDGAICTTKFDADGKIIEKITVFKDGSYIKDGFALKLLQGEGQTYDGTVGLVFVTNDDIVNFKYVTINGEEIDPAYYTVEEGSIKVTLPIELLSILPNGTYTVGIVSTHGTVTVSFNIGVSDNGVSVWLWIGIAAAVVALAGGTVAAIVIVKNRKKEEVVAE